MKEKWEEKEKDGGGWGNNLCSRRETVCEDEELQGLTLKVHDSDKEKTTHVSIYTMIKWNTLFPKSRRNFFLITFNWVANALVYNGLSYYSANLNVSSHLGFFIRFSSYCSWFRFWFLFLFSLPFPVPVPNPAYVPVPVSPFPFSSSFLYPVPDLANAPAPLLHLGPPAPP